MNACISLMIGLSVLQSNEAETSHVPDAQTGFAQVALESVPPAPAAEGEASAPCAGCQSCNSCESCCHDSGCGCCGGADPYYLGGGCCGKYHQSTCDMPPHYAYPPKYHGYYYFAPYNYQHVLAHVEMITRLNGDPRAPYQTAMFEAIYADGIYQEEMGSFRVPRPFQSITEQLPNLQQLLNE